ncbi:MAG: hypothetical protein MJE12_07900, partial [Alphaproteobacteria bacterium]|nr:hypothetical protein [Alphaproteobacteria bacterium]
IPEANFPQISDLAGKLSYTGSRPTRIDSVTLDSGSNARSPKTLRFWARVTSGMTKRHYRQN